MRLSTPSPRPGLTHLLVRISVLLGVLGTASVLGAQPTAARSSCSTVNARAAVAIHAPSAPVRALSLCDGRAVSLGSAAPAQGTPLTLASGDFDEDGVQDLVSGHATGSGGSLTVYRGNIAALWPYGAAAQNGAPEPFLPNPHTLSLPIAPDLLVEGDFDADGHQDLIAAQQGSNALYFLKGNGHGDFAPAKRITVAGSITAMIAGEINQVDGLADVVVAVTGDAGSAVLVYQSSSGALNGEPEVFPLQQPATALALGKFSDIALRDLVIGAGSDLVMVRGRDRHLPNTAQPAVLTRQTLSFNIRSIAAGDFTSGGPSLAIAGDDGKLHVLEHSLTGSALAQAVGNAAQATMQPAAPTRDGLTTGMSGSVAIAAQARVAAASRMAGTLDGPDWTERSSVSLPGGQAAPRLVVARISGSLQDDLVLADGANSQLHVLSTVAPANDLRAMSASNGPSTPAQAGELQLLASLDAANPPAAVLPMRLNQHGLSGLVVLARNETGPVVMPRDVPPTQTFVVTNTLDITDSSQRNSPPAGSLRAAMNAAQAASSANSGGSYSITFNIPTTDPGYDSTTGVYTIKPLSENVPGSSDNFALPPINATLTIDGYTQPGASPNTLPNGDNAKIVIRIDGSKASTPGGSGLVPSFDTGTVIRGLAFTGWTTPSYSSNNTASGAEGIELNGVADFVEGNFFGTVDGKTAIPNRIGIFADNGPLTGTAAGNTVGGTTPQARNILSGNTIYGIAFLSIAYEGRLQGNFIGVDSTGTAAMPNGFDGVGMNGPTVTIGGTLAGARNVISANPTNVDINDLTNGNAATGSYVQGNYIGLDATGTKALSPNSTGVSILHNPKNYLIGGPTASARNVISGNKYGVYIFDSSFSNIIQGNYIGTDATGSVAVPNAAQGFISGATTSTSVPAGLTTISGNVISGNGADGIQISGTVLNAGTYNGNTIQGNSIGTDATGAKSLPNGANGVSLAAGATNNVIGGSNAGQGNLIANNVANGVLIDPGSTGGPGVNNVTIANTIASNGGAGVRVVSGTANRISANSIYNNAMLGIDIASAGPNTNSHCNATNTGANMQQNYPVLTAGPGTAYISATATDPNGNTSEFSKAVQATGAGSLLTLLGSFDGTANTTFTIEFFSNPSSDPSGYGQGKTYLGSTSITTDANCSGTISDPVDTTQADVSVVLTRPADTINLGPDFGYVAYSASVANNGPATAHNVVFTDTLPPQLAVSSTYCNVGACQSPIVTSQGTCTVSGKTITCNLGTMAAGGTAQISIPVQAVATGGVTNSASVSATEVDPNLANNTSSTNATAAYPYAFIDHLDPGTVIAGSSATPLTIYGIGFTNATTVTYNGTSLPVQGVVDNQVCGGSFSPSFCTALQVVVPATLLTTAGSGDVEVMNPGVGQSGSTLNVVAGCTYSVFSSIGSAPDAAGTDLIATGVSVSTNVASCPWTAASTVPWATILDNASSTGSGRVDVAIAPNNTTSPRTGSITVAGQTLNFTQAAGSASVCTAAFDTSTITAPSTGASGIVNVTLSDPNCSHFIEAYPSSGWITITNKSNLLIGGGQVNYTIAPNNGPARTGSITVGGNVITVSQAAPSCYFAINPTSTLASAAGATGTITVTPSPSSCAWTATPSTASQVTVTSGASGTGIGTVNYTVAANTGGPIQPTITIGNSTSSSIFTINQASAYTCTFTLTPNPKSVTSNGTSDYFKVTASFNFCKWTASSNDPDSLSITGGASGMGNGVVYYNVAKNTGTTARTLTITAGCQLFTVNQDGGAATNPVPSITTLTPSSVVAGSGAFTLTVTGTNFINGSTVNINGVARTTTYVSATQLTSAILASDVATAGTPAVTVTNASPGGGTSNAVTLTVTAPSNPVPSITTLQPSTIAAGSAAFTLTVNGSGFVSGSTVNFNGAARTTTYVSATQLTAAIPASDVANTGTAAVTVTSPTPGGGTSNSVSFTITAANNPVPTITSLSPSSTTAGSGAFTLTVTGTNFVSGSTVNFNGTARATTYVSATQLTAAILAGDVASAGSASVTVTNPTPGGGSSNSATFTITAPNNPVPAITSLSPSSVTAGASGFTLTVTGANFINGSTVSFNGAVRATTFVSATQLSVAVLASDVATSGTAAVVVTNPTPGGGASNAVSFTIAAVATNPVPAIASLSPSSATAGTGAFKLTVTGSNFISSSTVNFNGTARATTYVSATQLTVAVLAADIATAGTASITVVNPTPGGGTSNAVSFTISNSSAGFTLSSSTPSQSLVPGGSATYAITATATNGAFAGSIALSASGLPAGATATFAPATLSPGSSSATSTLTITVPATRAAVRVRSGGGTWLAFLLPVGAFLLLGKGKRARFSKLAVLAIGLAISMFAVTGCGGGFSYYGSNPQTFNVTVTGTSGSIQQTTTLQLTVKY